MPCYLRFSLIDSTWMYFSTYFTKYSDCQHYCSVIMDQKLILWKTLHQLIAFGDTKEVKSGCITIIDNDAWLHVHMVMSPVRHEGCKNDLQRKWSQDISLSNSLHGSESCSDSSSWSSSLELGERCLFFPSCWCHYLWRSHNLLPYKWMICLTGCFWLSKCCSDW